MSVLAIIAALLLEQWRPLGDRKAVAGALSGWADWLERSFDAGELRHGRIAWLVAVLLPVAAVIALHELLFHFSPFAALLLNIGVLYLTLGFRQFSHYFTDIRKALDAGMIVKEYRPEKIILFGSYAYGTPNQDSDIDLLIIKETKERPIDRRVAVSKIIYDPKLRVSIEPIVITPEEINQQGMKDPFFREILTRGRTLYAA